MNLMTAKHKNLTTARNRKKNNMSKHKRFFQTEKKIRDLQSSFCFGFAYLFTEAKDRVDGGSGILLL